MYAPGYANNQENRTKQDTPHGPRHKVRAIYSLMMLELKRSLELLLSETLRDKNGSVTVLACMWSAPNGRRRTGIPAWSAL